MNHETNVLQLHLDDVSASSQSDLVQRVETNTLRYQRLFYRAADRLIRDLQPTVDIDRDSHDIWLAHRSSRFAEARRQALVDAGMRGTDRPTSTPTTRRAVERRRPSLLS